MDTLLTYVQSIDNPDHSCCLMFDKIDLEAVLHSSSTTEDLKTLVKTDGQSYRIMH